MQKKQCLIAGLLAVVMLICTVPTVVALDSPYSVSAAYRDSAYYTNLTAVELRADKRANLLAVARSQVGYHEGDSAAQLGGENTAGSNNYTEYGYWFGTQVKGNTYGHYYDWCAMFVSWCARQAGISTALISNAAYAKAANETYCFQNTAYYARGTYTPQGGDLIFFDWDGASDSWDHVGIVTGSDENYVYTVEGNGDNAVVQRSYALTDPCVRGYGVPNYENTVPTGKEPHPTLHALCPIKAYPCVTMNFEAKKADYSSRAGEIYTTDFCTVNAVYNDGWCQVTFPLDSGGTITGYTPISNFIYDVNYGMRPYHTDLQIPVYTRKDLSENLSWWVGAGDTFYAVGDYGDAVQVLYPIAEQYGGGYKLGWIKKSDLPGTTIYTVSYDANGGVGAPPSHDTTATISMQKPTRTGYTFLGWAEPKNATAATYLAGQIYPYENDVTLYAVWKANTYTVAYNANGGAGTMLSSSHTYDTAKALSANTFARTGYTFLGWSTSPAATTATYTDKQSVKNLTATNGATVTLYAVWEKIVPATVYGDANGDGMIDAGDAVLISRYDAGEITLTAEQLKACDVNGDGIVDAGDAVLISRYDAGLIEGF